MNWMNLGYFGIRLLRKFKLFSTIKENKSCDKQNDEWGNRLIYECQRDDNAKHFRFIIWFMNFFSSNVYEGFKLLSDLVLGSAPVLCLRLWEIRSLTWREAFTEKRNHSVSEANLYLWCEILTVYFSLSKQMNEYEVRDWFLLIDSFRYCMHLNLLQSRIGFPPWAWIYPTYR